MMKQYMKIVYEKNPLFFIFLILFGGMVFFEEVYELLFGGRNFFDFVFIFLGTLLTIAIFLYIALKITGEWNKKRSD